MDLGIDLKNIWETVKDKMSSGPIIIYSLTVVFSLLMLWFIINNFVFLTTSLNNAFGPSVEDVEVEREMFDREGFESLGF